jgi:hypothetical protein
VSDVFLTPSTIFRSLLVHIRHTPTPNMSDKSSSSRDAPNNSNLPAAIESKVPADYELSIMSNPPSREDKSHIINRIEETVWVGHSETGSVNSNFTCGKHSSTLSSPSLVIVWPYTQEGAPTKAERDKLPALTEDHEWFRGNSVIVINGRIYSFVKSDLPRSESNVPNPIYDKDENGHEPVRQELDWWPMKIVELEYTRK